MEQLPKIVKARLRTQMPAEHPNADVLTAFSEQSLPIADRIFVMEHIARCGDCREVLALALPEMEEAPAGATVRRPWLRMPEFSMPILRWGAIAAAFVVVVSVGVLRYRQGTPQMTASVKDAREATFHAADNGSPAPAISLTKEKQASQNFAVTAKTDRGADKPSPIPSATGSNAARIKANPKERTNLDSLSASSNTFAARMRPAPPPQTQTGTVNVASESSAPSTEPSQSTSDQAEVSGTTERELSEERRVGKAKAPVAQAIGSPATATSRNSTAGLGMTTASIVSAPGPRWTITPAGGLQRSYDEGKTWQDISVIANLSTDKVAMQAENGALSAQSTPPLKKQKDLVASPILRAISASGSEIWAGAAGGVLYHSSDAGGHWMSIIPSDHGTLLTGDIVSVEFGDVSHGRAATSTSEIWTTADSGQHWSKQ